MDEPLANNQAALADPPPPSEEEVPAGAPSAPPAAKARRRDAVFTRTLLIELLTITTGVLIALSLQGVQEWVGHRRQVAKATAMIELELRDNLEEVAIVIASAETRRRNIGTALQLANELIENQNSTVEQINLGFEIAELTSASWDTAERTGALALMDYEQARAYSRVYEAQARFLEHQNRTLEQLESAAANMSADPYGALPGDIEKFRESVLAMVGMLDIEQQLATALEQSYRDAMGEGPSTGSGS